jgi:tRNA(fMet)-specific endonuclease VapC
MVCCDTTFIIDLIRKDSYAINKLKEVVSNREGLSITVITVAELYYGAYKSKNVEEEIFRIHETILRFSILEMNEESAKEYGRIRALLERRGIKIPDRDLFIAAISLSHDENVIITRNKRDFEEIPGLTVHSY